MEEKGNGTGCGFAFAFAFIGVVIAALMFALVCGLIWGIENIL